MRICDLYVTNRKQETLSTRKDDRDVGRIFGQALVNSCKNRRRKYRNSQGPDELSPLLPDTRKPHPKPEPPPHYSEVFTRQANLNLVAYTILAFHSVAYDQLIPVFLHLPPQPDRHTNLAVQFQFKFAGGFGLDVSFCSA